MVQTYDILQRGYVVGTVTGTILPQTPFPMHTVIYRVTVSNPTTGTVTAIFTSSRNGTVTGTVAVSVLTPNSNYEAKGTDEVPVGVLQSMEALSGVASIGSVMGVVTYSYRYGRAY